MKYANKFWLVAHSPKVFASPHRSGYSIGTRVQPLLSFFGIREIKVLRTWSCILGLRIEKAQGINKKSPFSYWVSILLSNEEQIYICCFRYIPHGLGRKKVMMSLLFPVFVLFNGFNSKQFIFQVKSSYSSDFTITGKKRSLNTMDGEKCVNYPSSYQTRSQHTDPFTSLPLLFFPSQFPFVLMMRI